jgi:hypothetical protein
MSWNLILRIFAPPPKARKPLQTLSTISMMIGVAICIAGGPAHRDKHNDLVSVLPRANDVLASTCDGIYRSVHSVHHWERLAVPGNLPLGGTFAAAEEDPANIYYYCLYDPLALAPERSNPRDLDAGLFRSQDDGSTWTVVDRETHVHCVLVLHNGTVGTLQLVPDESNPRARRLRRIIRCSKDHGTTWTDITHNADDQGDKLIVDPDNGSIIALYVATGSLDYLLQADDEHYIWKARSIDSLLRVIPTDAQFFWRYCGGDALVFCQATLSSYFEKPFQNPLPIPNQVSIPAFDITAEQAEYHFNHSGPKMIQVKLTFDPGSDQASELVDDDDENAFWSAKVIDPAGRRKTSQNSAPHATPTTVPSTHPTPNRFSVSRLHPYRRKIDLAPLVDFTVPGKYRVQLKYDNSPDFRDYRDKTWHGSFSGEVFTVVIGKWGA